ncbi:MAG: hypothetical protein HYU68_15005 [Bacteroidetes bacterium]|nr:hypothetical protein [Bacteroidota bacterium]
MIGVWATNDCIKITITSTLIDVKAVKDIVRTITKISKKKTLKKEVLLIESIHQVNFTKKGELFYKRITSEKKLRKMKVSIIHEEKKEY